MMMLYSVSKICDEMKLMDDETSSGLRENHSRVFSIVPRTHWFKPPDLSGWEES
jgi:hypothetical protein